jgi:hypothetical protein
MKKLLKKIFSGIVAIIITVLCAVAIIAMLLGSIWLSYILVAGFILVVIFLIVKSIIMDKIDPEENEEILP